MKAIFLKESWNEYTYPCFCRDVCFRWTTGWGRWNAQSWGVTDFMRSSVGQKSQHLEWEDVRNRCECSPGRFWLQEWTRDWPDVAEPVWQQQRQTPLGRPVCVSQTALSLCEWRQDGDVSLRVSSPPLLTLTTKHLCKVRRKRPTWRLRWPWDEADVRQRRNFEEKWRTYGGRRLWSEWSLRTINVLYIIKEWVTGTTWLHEHKYLVFFRYILET